MCYYSVTTELITRISQRDSLDQEQHCPGATILSLVLQQTWSARAQSKSSVFHTTNPSRIMDLPISIELCALYPALDWALTPSVVTLSEFDVAIQMWW